MTDSPREYGTRARAILRESPRTRDSVTTGALNLDGARRTAYAGVDSGVWRSWAGAVKAHLLTHLADYLEEAERQLTRHGVAVHWAESAADAASIVAGLAKQYGVRVAVKGKSMMSEEAGLNRVLQQDGIEVFETDLGEYIIQLLEEPPSHIIAPAIHRDLDDVRAVFADRFGMKPDATPGELAAKARSVLREAFLRADMGITGGNFLVAETGTIVLVENEGNIRLTTSMPRVHVALIGLEKLLPRFSDLAMFLQLISRAATGQAIGTFVSLIRGPRSVEDVDGPEAVHVILVDGGRSSLLADPEAWEALRCIRCGACLNACPVYRQTGGHAYGWSYSGPIASILAPALLGLEEGGALPFASTLCGACAEACPVGIPIPRLLHEWRERVVDAGLLGMAEGSVMRAYASVMTHPTLYRMASRALRVPGAMPISSMASVVRHWSEYRGALEPSPRSFLQMWRDGIE